MGQIWLANQFNLALRSPLEYIEIYREAQKVMFIWPSSICFWTSLCPPWNIAENPWSKAGLLKWWPVGQIRPADHTSLAHCQLQYTQKYIAQWWSFGPQTSIFELSSTLCGPQEKIIEKPWSKASQKLFDQYQACLNSFECNYYSELNYDYASWNLEKNISLIVENFDLSPTPNIACRWLILMFDLGLLICCGKLT